MVSSGYCYRDSSLFGKLPDTTVLLLKKMGGVISGCCPDILRTLSRAEQEYRGNEEEGNRAQNSPNHRSQDSYLLSRSQDVVLRTPTQDRTK